MVTIEPIILGSQSPRRRQLLEWAEIAFDVIVKETDESYPSSLSVEDIAIHIARNKALAVRSVTQFMSAHADKVVLAADTIVVLNDNVIGKPADRDDAVRILSLLAGNTHKVITGVVILKGSREIFFADVTEVDFHPLNRSQLEYYVDKFKPYDKAGAYAIQEWIGVTSIKSIRGDFYNVMGLPVSRVVKILQEI